MGREKASFRFMLAHRGAGDFMCWRVFEIYVHLQRKKSDIQLQLKIATMSIIKPFKGFRPPVNIVEKLASRPYDVLNSEEARKECEGNPYSLLHVTKAEIDLPQGTDEHSLEVYLQVVKN